MKKSLKKIAQVLKDKTPAEKVIKDTTEKIEEKADKASEKIEDATEDVK